MNDMKRLIQNTIIEMFENGDLQIETHLEDDGYSRKKLTTTIYHYPDEALYKQKINSFSGDY